MVDLPHDILLLIADYFDPSELRTLASFHRYFLYEYLRQRYRQPVVLIDCADGERLYERQLKSDLKRIRRVLILNTDMHVALAHAVDSGPLVRKSVQRVELRSGWITRESRLSSILFSMPWSRIITAKVLPWEAESIILRTLHSLRHLRALHITHFTPPPRDVNSASPAPSAAWLRSLSAAWPYVAPRLEELHVVGSTSLLQAVFSLKTRLYKALSTLWIEGCTEQVVHHQAELRVTKTITKFVTALRGQLVSFAILKTRTPMTPRFLLGLGDLGNGASARTHRQPETDFPRLRALRIDAWQYFTHGRAARNWTLLSLVTNLVNHYSHLRTLNIRYHCHDNHALMIPPLSTTELEMGVMKNLRRLDLDLVLGSGPYANVHHGVWPSYHVDTQKRILDDIHLILIDGPEELRLNLPVAWAQDPCTDSNSGVASVWNSIITFGSEPRIFQSLQKLSINVPCLRAQIFEDLREGAPRLDSMRLEFQCLSYSQDEYTDVHNGDESASYTVHCSPQVCHLCSLAVSFYSHHIYVFFCSIV
jgi:hypothetical protein